MHRGQTGREGRWSLAGDTWMAVLLDLDRDVVMLQCG